MSLFRSEVIEGRRRKLWGDVRLSQPPSLAIWTWVLSAAGGAIILGLAFGVYIRKETVKGYLEPEGGIIQITSQQNGRITKVNVREGEHVVAGQSLIELSGETVGAKTGQVLAAQIQQVDQQIDDLNQRKMASASGLESDALRLGDQIRAQISLRNLLQKRRADQSQLLDIATNELSRVQVLADKGYASQVQLDQRKEQTLILRGDINDIDRQLSEAESTIRDLQIQLSAMPGKRAETMAGLNTDLSTLQQKRIDFSSVALFIERSPVSGKVSNLGAEVGQSAAPNEPLISVMPDGSALQAELLVPTRAAGFIKVGDEVRGQVDAFPFQRFGFAIGHIVSISKSVLKPEEFLAPVDMKEAFYRVRVSLDKDYVVAYGKKQALTPGMSLTADIIIERKPLWRQLFDPILAARKRSR